MPFLVYGCFRYSHHASISSFHLVYRNRYILDYIGSIAIDNSAHYQNPLDPPVSVQTFSLTFIRARATGTRVSGSIQTIDY